MRICTKKEQNNDQESNLEEFSTPGMKIENLILKPFPFYYKKYWKAKSSIDIIKSYIGITFLILNFSGFVLFLLMFYFSSTNARLILMLLAIMQNFIRERLDIYYNFIKNFEAVKYFKSFTIILEEELDESKLLLPSVPHGIITLTMSLAILNGHPCLRKCSILGSRFLVWLPFSGLLSRIIGISGVNHNNFIKYMEQGKNIFFIPGGFECGTVTDWSRDRAFLSIRKGFIKYALMYGYKIHPIYNFGENKLFYTFKKYTILEKWGFILNKIKIPLVIAFGKFFIFPYDQVDLCCVIGKGIQLPKISKPSREDIEKYHCLYLSKLQELFNKYKHLYNASEKLEII